MDKSVSQGITMKHERVERPCSANSKYLPSLMHYFQVLFTDINKERGTKLIEIINKYYPLILIIVKHYTCLGYWLVKVGVRR